MPFETKKNVLTVTRLKVMFSAPLTASLHAYGFGIKNKSRRNQLL